MEKILLDTDIGGDIDDAVCLAYLLKEPQCALLGITTVCGESEKRAAVADAVCRAAGRKIPIAAGLDTTLQPVPVYPTPGGAGALAHWPHDTFEKADAPAFLYRKIRENPHEVILIGIGNMTNIATLFLTYPDAVGLLKGLYVMNGYFGEKPLPDPYYNWNSWADPLASKIVFAAQTAVNRAVPLEITDTLTVGAEQAGTLLRPNSDLMRAVFDFGSAWLLRSEKLTLHDPLAAVCVFHPEVCTFRRGFVETETEEKSNLGGTRFIPDANGNAEIADSVNRERFYSILSRTLCGEAPKAEKEYRLPKIVEQRARSAGAVGEAWLANLPRTVAELEEKWQISVGKVLSGGSHAFTAFADGANGEQYVLKIDMPEDLGGDFQREIAVLKAAGGHGYAKLYAYDLDKKASLTERLGKPLNRLGYSVTEQLKIICAALKTAWELPVTDRDIPGIRGSVDWFRAFIAESFEKLGRPCSESVIRRAFEYLKNREEAENPAAFVLLHGDPHGGNALQTLSGDGFKWIDPDGIYYEKAYDLGVLMREWREEYREDPIQTCKARCALLSKQTGVDARAIFEWGFVQCVSTGMVMQNVSRPAAKEFFSLAESWCAVPPAALQ